MLDSLHSPHQIRDMTIRSPQSETLQSLLQEEQILGILAALAVTGTDDLRYILGVSLLRIAKELRV